MMIAERIVQGDHALLGSLVRVAIVVAVFVVLRLGDRGDGK